METREVGRSGVGVTRVVLGCGNFGGVGSAPAFFGQGIPKDVAFRIMDRAWELGITTFDTADAYGGGRSEAWIGEWLRSKGSAVRSTLVVQTKTFNPMDEGEDEGLSRARIRRQITTSLARLGLDRVPLYLAHAFDEAVPQEETLGALDELVREGVVGAIGTSNFSGDQLAEAVEISELEGLARYEIVQNSYSLLDAGDAQTVLPVCREHGLGYEAFGPLAGGWLAARYKRGQAFPPGSRMTQRPEPYEAYLRDHVFDAVESFETEAGDRGVSAAALAFAWLLAQDEVTAVVAGPTRPEHLDPVEEALDVKLDRADVIRIREVFP